MQKYGKYLRETSIDIPRTLWQNDNKNLIV